MHPKFARRREEIVRGVCLAGSENRVFSMLPFRVCVCVRAGVSSQASADVLPSPGQGRGGLTAWEGD
eukprot:1024519-Alexandrium_andersonii.AAC.1